MANPKSAPGTPPDPSPDHCPTLPASLPGQADGEVDHHASRQDHWQAGCAGGEPWQSPRQASRSIHALWYTWTWRMEWVEHVVGTHYIHSDTSRSPPALSTLLAPGESAIIACGVLATPSTTRQRPATSPAATRMVRRQRGAAAARSEGWAEGRRRFRPSPPRRGPHGTLAMQDFAREPAAHQNRPAREGLWTRTRCTHARGPVAFGGYMRGKRTEEKWKKTKVRRHDL